MQICPKCGQEFNDYPCKTCREREARIEKDLGRCLIGASAGFCATSIANFFFPPLDLSWLIIYSMPAIVLLTVPIGFVFVHWRQLLRYSTFFRVAIFLIAAAFVVPAPYYFLNGLLDRTPPVAMKAIVSQMPEAGNNIEWTMMWKGKKVVGVSQIDQEMLSTLNLGDPVSVLIHQGKFSEAWFSRVGPWTSLTRDAK